MIDYLEIIETTFTYHRKDDRGIEPLFEGTPDRVLIFTRDKPRTVAVLDRKFGRIEVQEAALNLQLRCYIAMVAEVHQADEYYGAIVQPRVRSKPYIVRYTPEDVARARSEIEETWREANKPEAPRRASELACAFCRAKPVCPEFHSWAMAVEKIAHLPVAQWSDDQMDLFESRRSILEKFLKDAHEQIKAIKAADPSRLPGWRLKPGNNVRTVEDVVSAWLALKDTIDARQFSGCCDLSVSDLERLLWEIGNGNITQSEAKRLVNDALKDVLSFKQNRPSLVKDE